MADSEVQESKLSLYEFNIRMYTLMHDAYSDIKHANVDSAVKKLQNIISEVKSYHDK